MINDVNNKQMMYVYFLLNFKFVAIRDICELAGDSHFFQAHWVRCIQYANIFNLEYICPVHRFVKAENALLLTVNNFFFQPLIYFHSADTTLKQCANIDSIFPDRGR